MQLPRRRAAPWHDGRLRQRRESRRKRREKARGRRRHAHRSSRCAWCPRRQRRRARRRGSRLHLVPAAVRGHPLAAPPASPRPVLLPRRQHPNGRRRCDPRMRRKRRRPSRLRQQRRRRGRRRRRRYCHRKIPNQCDGPAVPVRVRRIRHRQRRHEFLVPRRRRAPRVPGRSSDARRVQAAVRGAGRRRVGVGVRGGVVAPGSGRAVRRAAARGVLGRRRRAGRRVPGR